MGAAFEPIDLVAHGLVKGMPAAWLAGRESDLLAPLRLLAPGTLPEWPTAKRRPSRDRRRTEARQ